jgi:vacuolar-type H+-ATPase subunit F/Vma7
MEIWRVREDNTWVQIHKTEVIKKSLDPRWNPFTLKMQTLCNGDHRRPIQFKIFDYDGDGKPGELIGEVQTTVKELMDTKDPHLTLKRPNKNKKDADKPRGTLVFNKFEVFRETSFLDYIKGGMQISLLAAIDFTGSNGHPDSPDSLHYRHGKGPNEYQQAISVVGQIVEPYDTDKRFPVWGFGGKVGNMVSHCFPLTFNPNSIEVQGIRGILEVYANAFQHVQLSGPTYFSEIIRTADAIASRPYTPTSQHYSILLILTDGIINDMKETIQAIVNTSMKPLSVIIIGVGSADFTQMDQLDADNKALESNGKKAVRDIVQFVPFRKFLNQHISRLAAEVLAEVPGQMLSFCKQFNIKPMVPRKPEEIKLEQKIDVQQQQMMMQGQMMGQPMMMQGQMQQGQMQQIQVGMQGMTLQPGNNGGPQMI